MGELTSINPVARAPAWFAVLGHLGADSPGRPVLRALAMKGNLANRALATKRGDHKKGGGTKDVQLLADQAGIPTSRGRR